MDKCDVLHHYAGCFKCWCFYAGHLQNECSDLPIHNNVITEDMGKVAWLAQDKKLGNKPRSDGNTLYTKVKTTATVIEVESEDETVADDESENVAAITLPSFVLGKERDDEDSDNLVSPDCPLTVPLLWNVLGDWNRVR